MFGKIRIAAVTAVSLVLITGITAVAAPSDTGSAAAGSSSSASSSAVKRGARFAGMRKGQKEMGFRTQGVGDAAVMQALAKLDGTTAKDLRTHYPKQTAWQIAQKLGKLSALKQDVVSEYQTMLTKMVDKKTITSDESAKMLADLKARLAKIDGTTVVTLGKPSYAPKTTARSGHAAKGKFGHWKNGKSSAPSASSSAASSAATASAPSVNG